MTVTTPAAVRPADLGDLPHLAQMDKEIFGPISYPLFVFRQMLDLVEHGLIVAVVDNGIVGYAMTGIRADRRTAYFMSLGVDPRCHRRGYGRQLAEVSLANLRTGGAETVHLTVDPMNLPAIAMYQRLGFHEIRRESNYFGDNEERVIMRAELTRP